MSELASTPKYVTRFARLPEVFLRLSRHPEGIRLAELADAVGVPVNELREDLLTFYAADPGTMLLGLTRPDVLEFVGPGGDAAEPTTAEIVRIGADGSTEELGVEYVNPAELALVYGAARALLEIEPDNEHLAAAIDVLTETMELTDSDDRAAGSVAEQADWHRPLDPLHTAVDERRQVRIVYSRTWHEGVIDRVIEPYRLVQTRRDWEVDAGPPDEDGRLRTYLLSNLRELDLLDETFTPPDDLAARLDAQRATSRVRMRIPHDASWTADFYAESHDVVDSDDDTVTLDLDLLPPVEQRVGLIMLVAGLDTRVLDPAELISTGPRLAGALLAHHLG